MGDIRSVFHGLHFFDVALSSLLQYICCCFLTVGGGNGNFGGILLYDGHEGTWSPALHNLSFGREQVMGASTQNGLVGMAGGSIGAYEPSGFTRRVDIFALRDLLPPRP